MLAVVPQKRASPVVGSSLYSSPRLTLPSVRPWKKSFRYFLWGTSSMPQVRRVS